MQKVIVSVALDPADAAKLQAVRRSREVIPSLSAVAREMLLTGLQGGGVPVELPSLDMMPDDLDVMRDTLAANEKTHASRTRALLQWYDEVCALMGQYPTPDYRPVPVPPAAVPVAQVVPAKGAVSR